MDPQSSASAATNSNHQNRPPYMENGTSSQEENPRPSTSGATNSWYEGYQNDPHDRVNGWNGGRATANSRPREALPPGSQDMMEVQQPYHPYGYPPADASYMNGGQNAIMVPQWHMGNVNPQWAMDSMNVAPPVCTPTPMAMNAGMDMSSSPAVVNPYAYMNAMPPDPAMYGLMNYAHYAMMGAENNQVVGPKHEVVHLTECVLYPPNGNAPPQTRAKPIGCKTVFVGGLPENITSKIVEEIFRRFGELDTVRMSKKNFCHVRYFDETAVDFAIFYSGYRIKINGKDDEPNCGRLHVDYAQARKDAREYECQKRQEQREVRHRERFENEFYRQSSSTPPLVPHYSDHEADTLSAQLRQDESFQQAVVVLKTWLDRGECTRKNAPQFFSLLQSTNSRVHRLLADKESNEEELQKAKTTLQQQMYGISFQFTEIGKVFNAACVQKVSDHFPRPQRKMIELWKKQTEEIRNAHNDDVINEREEVGMELSDEEDQSPKDVPNQGAAQPPPLTKSDLTKEIEKLRLENSSLHSQLQASEKAVSVARSEKEARSRQNATHRNMHQEMEDTERDMRSMRVSGSEMKDPNHAKKRKEASNDLSVDQTERVPRCDGTPEMERGACSAGNEKVFTIAESHARVVGLISTFLVIHPFGANIDYLCSYLQQIDKSLCPRKVEFLMEQFPTVFKLKTTGIGATIEKKWMFRGLGEEEEEGGDDADDEWEIVP